MQLCDGVVRRCSASLGDALEPFYVITFDADEHWKACVLITFEATQILTGDVRQNGIEFSGLRILGCPGSGTHRHDERRLRSASDEL